MCRLTAITGSDPMRLHYLDRLLLMAELDGGQNDGFGITDGTFLYKTECKYSETIPGWITLPEFQNAPFILSHVRKASAYTGKGKAESHPYEFTVRGMPFMCAHNGYIYGTGTHRFQSDDPDTDSWRAFNALAALVEQEGEITPDVIHNWLLPYNESSLIGIMILWNRQLYIFRHNKPLHYMPFSDGYIIHTSDEVLKRFQRYLLSAHGIPPTEMQEVPENNLMCITENDIHMKPVDVKLKEYNYHKQADIIPVNTTATQRASPITTTPPLLVAPLASDPKLWKTAIQQVNPLRIPLFLYWLKEALGYDVQGLSIRELAISVDAENLEFFMAMIGKLTARQRQLINAWNNIIKKGYDIEVHNSLFMKSWFWLDPLLLDTTISDEEALEYFRAEICIGIVQYSFFNKTLLTQGKLQEYLSV